MLENIEVVGFRSIRQQDLDLGPVTVLIGANGSGKSGFLDIFTLLRFLSEGALQLYVAKCGGANALLHYGAKHTEVLKLRLRRAFPQGPNVYSLALTRSADDSLIFEEESVHQDDSRDASSVQAAFGAGHRESLLAREKDPDLVDSRTLRRLLSQIQTYHFHDTSPDSAIRSKQSISQTRRLESRGENLVAYLYGLKLSHPAYYAQILRVYRTIVPCVHELILEPDATNPERIALRWRDRDPTYEFGGYQLSDGSLRALALVTALLQPESSLPPILVFDEPELGLHPSGIATLASLFKEVSKQRQLVLATQSSSLVSHFTPEQVVVVEREPGKEGETHGHSTFRRLDSKSLRGWLADYDLGTLYEMQITGGAPQ